MFKKTLLGLFCGGLGAAVALSLWLAGSLQKLESATWAWRVTTFARPSNATEKIRIILLDQASLDWGYDVNGWSWPWPREVYGPIVDFCRRAGARSLAFDVLLTEPSCLGVYDDEALGQAISRSPGFVGALFLAQAGGRAHTWPDDFTRPGWSVSGLEAWLDQNPQADLVAQTATLPIPEVAQATPYLANVSDTPDADGIFRRVRLVQYFDGQGVPALGLAAYGLGFSPEGPPNLALVDRILRVGNLRVPLDAKGRTILRFVGPTGTHPTVSAAAVIQSELRILAGEKPALAPDFFTDCFVLFGFSAPGLLDLRPTPVSRVYPGVELHATVLDNLITGSFLQDASQAAVVMSTLVLALLSALIIVYSKRVWQSVVSIVILLPLPLATGLVAYNQGFWLPVVVGTVAVGFSLGAGIVTNYATEGRQKQFIKQAFKYYLSPEVIERILADPSQLSLGGERRELSILFADLAGFTSISEQLDPHDLTELLNNYLSAMTDIVLAAGGTLDKYEGDAFIAFWNAPLPQPDHAARACRAALLCQRELAARRQIYRGQTGHQLNMRIGVHTGEVVVGNLGSQQRFNYTVLGDAANLASRLEGANKMFGTGILISAATRDQAGANILAREIGHLRVVGRTQAVQVYEVLGLAGEKPAVAAEAFARGLALLAAGQVTAARELFQQQATDPVSQRYLERCQELLQAGGEEWDGVWQLTEK
jgi:adenylate cyclase